MKQTLRIITRKSILALWQAKLVQKKLLSLYPYLDIPILETTTEGDRRLDTPLYDSGGKGLFVKALEEYLLEGKADIAVHSLKDMPAELPEDLELSAILEREDPRDAFISFHFPSVQSLPAHARVGTSSLRRQSQLYALRRDVKVTLLRGNVDTRIHKLKADQYDAIILAMAGLKRLGLEHLVQECLPPQFMLPAVGQGALCIECRISDESTKSLLKPLHHLPTAQCVLAERSMSQALEGGCHLPIAGLAEITSEGLLALKGMVASPDGYTILKAEAIGLPDQMMQIGQEVAKELLAKGAREIVKLCT